MATYAIGDVQGCWDQLRALLERIGPTAGDRLWLTGDLVNRGPRSLEVLRFAVGEGDRLVAVLGNHDLHLISCARGLRKPRKSDTFHDVLEAPDRDRLIDWLARRPFVHREGQWLMVHAGLLPDWSSDDAERLAREVEGAGLTGDLLGSWRKAPRRWRADLDPAERRALAVSAFVTLRCVDREVCDGGGWRIRFAPGSADLRLCRYRDRRELAWPDLSCGPGEPARVAAPVPRRAGR